MVLNYFKFSFIGTVDKIFYANSWFKLEDDFDYFRY